LLLRHLGFDAIRDGDGNRSVRGFLADILVGVIGRCRLERRQRRFVLELAECARGDHANIGTRIVQCRDERLEGALVIETCERDRGREPRFLVRARQLLGQIVHRVRVRRSCVAERDR